MHVMLKPAGAGALKRPSPQPRQVASVLDACGNWKVFQLLDGFCMASGFAPLQAKRIGVDDLPQPYRALLVHSKDMTPTLEGHYRDKAGLRILSRGLSAKGYSREVLLTTPRHGPVEYGVIRIDLALFPEVVRARILDARLPLGGLLLEHGIAHLCWPQGYFQFEPNGYLQKVMGLAQPAVLYGRRNVIVSGEHRLLADVLEILVPCTNSANLDS